MLALNRLTILLSLAAVVLAVIYPFMKRYTYLPQVYLGAAFGWAVPMAFAAVTGHVSPLAWLVFSTVILWVLVYDTEYAMVDRADDLRVGIKSTAILLADADRAAIALLQLILLIDLGLIGRQAALHWPYYFSLASCAGCFTYQQYLIRERVPEACFAAFMNNNWCGLLIQLGIVASYWGFPAA